MYVYVCIYMHTHTHIYELSFPINVSDSITVYEPKMAGWKWKPGTVANEKHSISEFDGFLFCYSIWLKFFSKQFIYSETKKSSSFPFSV